jgi:hypothetical protein
MTAPVWHGWLWYKGRGWVRVCSAGSLAECNRGLQAVARRDIVSGEITCKLTCAATCPAGGTAEQGGDR